LASNTGELALSQSRWWTNQIVEFAIPLYAR
jgi:hypothetical protein